MTIKEAITKYNLDRRRKWFAWYGNIVYSFNYSAPCSGCVDDGEYSSSNKGTGCHECGYSGKRRSSVPVPAFDENGQEIKITDKDFTYA